MHPVLFHFFFPVHTYGVLVAIAFLVGIWLTADRARRQGADQELVINLFMVILVSSILGARILYVLGNWEYYAARLPEIAMVQRGGLSYFGGLAGAVIGGWIYAYRKRRSSQIFGLLDLFMPALAIGQAIGRIGCYFNGCCHGIVTDGPWGVIFPQGSSVFADHMMRGWVAPFDAHSLPVLPTQLIASFLDVILFCVLIAADNRKRVAGATFFSYLIGYGLLRFCLEYLRADNPLLTGLQWTLWQFVSAAAMLAGALGLLVPRFASKRARN